LPALAPADWACVASWATRFEFVAVAVALELFVCVTGPSFPGLPMRMTMLMLVGATCFDVASALAVCVVGALWVDDCACPSCDSLGGGEALGWCGGDGGSCCCELLWCVPFELPADPALEEPLSSLAVAVAVCVVGAL
jgi:hypothetical protein